MKPSPLKKHAFWFLCGAVPLLVGIGVLLIGASVGSATADRLKEYKDQKDAVANAKPKGVGHGKVLDEQRGRLNTKVTALWGDNFRAQKKSGLFRWPSTPKADSYLTALERLDLPFGDDFLKPLAADAPAGSPQQSYLDAQQSELTEFASPNVYLKVFDDMAKSVSPTRFGAGGPAASSGGEGGPGRPGLGGPGVAGGGMQNTMTSDWPAVLRHVTSWGLVNKPTVPELWLALEDIWVQRELLACIARTNTALTKLEPEFQFWNYNPLKRRFSSRLWKIDLEVVTDPDRKRYLKASLTNPNDRLQMLGANKIMRLRVWLDNPNTAEPSLPNYVLGGELVPGYASVDVALQRTNPRNRNLPGNHFIPADDRLTVTRISRVEQILDEVSVPVKLIQALELGVTDHRRAAGVLVPPKLKGLPEDAAAGDTTGQPPAPGMPSPGGPGGRPGGPPGLGSVDGEAGEGAGYPGGPGGRGGAAVGAKRGPKEVVLLGNKNRYLEATDQVRRMPVALAVVLDEAYRQDLIVQFTNSPMRFHVTQIGLQRFRGSLPASASAGGAGAPRPGPGGAGGPGGPGAPPPSLMGPGGEEGDMTGFGSAGSTSPASTAQANAGLVTLSIYGVISLYNEMPVQEILLEPGESFTSDATSWDKPMVVSEDAKLRELFPDPNTQARIRSQFQPLTHDLLAFAWEGPPDSNVTFTVAEQAAKFSLSPGDANSTDKVQHRKLFAIRRVVKWTAE